MRLTNLATIALAACSLSAFAATPPQVAGTKAIPAEKSAGSIRKTLELLGKAGERGGYRGAAYQTKGNRAQRARQMAGFIAKGCA